MVSEFGKRNERIVVRNYLMCRVCRPIVHFFVGRKPNAMDIDRSNIEPAPYKIEAFT